MKLLLWAVIAAVVVMWLLRKNKQEAPAARTAGQQRDGQGQQTERMVRCDHCGVHIPVSEALSDASGAQFCSEDHRLQHGRSR